MLNLTGKEEQMPELKRRMIFISHAWNYDSDYWKLVDWFNDEPNFVWSNCSVPNHDALPDKTSAGLSNGMTRQISLAQVVIIIAGMYAAHSEWIDYEIDEALRMGKTIIGIEPWGQQRVPQKVQNAAKVMVGWNSASIVNAVRQFT
jgi:MTH538 TIR-like domain (DUF1863)